MEPQERLGILVSDDLIFTSRIAGTARDLGCTMKTARSVEGVEKLAAERVPACVLVDLALPGLRIEELIGRLRPLCATMPCVVAYGAHVDAAGLRRAREAGCDVVLPRSKFVEELPRALASWLQS